MRMLRHVVTALLLAVLGCSRPAPEPQIGDAGHVASAPRSPARPDAGSAPMATQRAPVVVPRPRRHRPDPSVADDRVLACTRNASDKASLMGCLGSFEAPAVDAGVAPKFASLAPVPPSKTSWLVPLWYVSAISGNDNNTCVTSGAPCKTFAEIVRRWQTDSPFISGGVTVQILSDLPQSDTIAWTPQYSDSAGNAFISGTATVIATGTLASVVANDHSTQALQADLGSTGRVGLEICDSTHPSCAQVALSVSGTTYTLTQPILNFAEVNTWANGDSFTIYQLPKAYFAHTANITIDSVWKFDGGAFGFYAESTDFTNGRVDDSAEIVATQFPGFVNEYSHGQGSLLLSDGELLGGFSTGPVLSSIFSGGLIGLDAIIATEADISGTGGVTIQGAYSTSGTLWHLAGMEIVVGFGSPGTGPMYGPSYQVDVARGRVIYAVDPGGTPPATAAASFLGGATLTIVGAAFGKACDLAHTPLQCLPDVALSPAQLDTSFVGGGFGGIATSADGLAGFAGFDNVGTWPSVSDLCGTGQFMTGKAPPFQCDTPTGTGASCPINLATCTTGLLPYTSLSGAPTIPTLTAGTGISVGTGPAYTVSNTGVLSVTGAGNVSCSPTTGAVTCTGSGLTASSVTGTGFWTSASGTLNSAAQSFPCTAAQGCTGVASPTAHTLPVNEGASAQNAITCTAGQTIKGVASADPTCVAIGGDATGAPDSLLVGGLDGHSISGFLIPGALVFTNAGAFSSVGASTAGNGMFSNGTDWLSAPQGPTTAFAARATASVPDTNTVTNINSTSLTIPSGYNLTATIAFDFEESNSDNGREVNFGVGVNSSSLYTVSQTTTVSPSTGTNAFGNATMVFQTSGSGSSITIHALSDSGTVAFTVGATILLTLTH